MLLANAKKMRWEVLLNYGTNNMTNSWASEGFFQIEPEVVKFYFTQSKLKQQPSFAQNLIGKCQISKCSAGQGPLASPSDARGQTIEFIVKRKVYFKYGSPA